MSEIKALEKLRELLDVEIGEAEPYFKGEAICDEIEAEIADNYMRLPLDADGEPIHVGDVMMDGKTPRYAVAVAPESFMMDGYETGSFYRPGLAKNHHHVKPRTLEDVLEDCINEFSHRCTEGKYDTRPTVAKYADEIRELLGFEIDEPDTIRNELLGGDAE